VPNHAENPVAPRPLTVAALVVLLEAVCFFGLAVVQAVTFDSTRSALGWTTIAFFALWGLMLAVGGMALRRSRSWARSPIVMAQLVQLGLAYNFATDAHSDRTDHIVAWLLAAVTLVVLVGIFHPRSINHLAAAES
jgi:peptidoglycan/LPS O-acetylase OafA/YrhL